MYTVMLDLIAFRASGGTLTEEEIQARIGAVTHPQQARNGAVAVLPLHGVMAQRMNMMSAMSGGTSTEQFGKAFTAAVADPAIGGIVIDIDSPGGSVFGVQELWQTVMNARGQKPVIAMANSMAASAAYWIATAADEIVVTPGGQMGSIGVLTAHSDMSAQLEMVGEKVTLISAGKKKVDGNPIEPLSAAARDDLQASVDTYYSSFVQSVAKGRNVAPGAVRSGFGQGGMVGAAEAVAQGMADRIGTLEVAIARAGGRRGFQAEYSGEPVITSCQVTSELVDATDWWVVQTEKCSENSCLFSAIRDGLCGHHAEPDEDTETRRRRLALQGLTRP